MILKKLPINNRNQHSMELTNLLQIMIAFYLGLVLLELSKFLMYETYYDKLQTFFGEKTLQLHYMDTDTFILSVSTKDNIKELKNLEDLFDFSNLNENHDLVSNKNKKVIDKFKIDTPKNIWIDEFIF